MTLQITPMTVLCIDLIKVSNIMNSLSHDFTILSKWFYSNFMVLNPDKCSFVLFGVDDELQTNLLFGNESLKTVNKKMY